MGDLVRQDRRRAVFLDRDGVLAEAIVRADGKSYAPTRVEDFVLVPEAPEQVQRLRDAGFLCIVFTNQPELANGELASSDLDAMHRTMRAAIPLDDVYVCPHDKSEGCRCHKPAAGMLDDASARWDVDLATSFVIGDRWRDVSAGKNAGCRTIFIDYGYHEAGPDRPDYVVSSLSEAGAIILQQRGAGCYNKSESG